MQTSSSKFRKARKTKKGTYKLKPGSYVFPHTEVSGWTLWDKCLPRQECHPSGWLGFSPPPLSVSCPRARHTIAGNKLTRRELSWASLENTKTQVEGFRALGTDCHPQHQGHENPVNPTVLSREAPDWNSSLPAYSNRAQVHDLNSITSYKGLFFSSLILKCLYLFTQLSMETY